MLHARVRGVPVISVVFSVVVVVSWPALGGCNPAAADAPGGVAGDDDDGEVLDAFARSFVDAHNAVRAAAQPAPSPPLPPVSWSEDVADVARDWAARCVFEHSSAALGENLAIFSSPSATPEQVVEAWASEVADYDYADNRCAAGAQCGHYTQVVWRDSTSIGCAAVACEDVVGFGDGLLFVCNYDPPGNYVGRRPY
jgi:pathogenesis-related protein 1